MQLSKSNVAESSSRMSVAASLPAESSAQGAGEAPSSHSGNAARVGLWALAVGFGGFLLWASFAPLDEGVPAAGVVAIDTKRKPVQHLTGGIIKQVLVREGEEVKEGQVLVRLDDAVSRSNYESVRQRYLGLRAMQGRLDAEARGSNSIVFHPDLVAAAKDPLIQQQMLTQSQLFESRRAGLQADMRTFEESIQGQQALALSYESMLINRKGQLASVSEELANTRALVKEGYAPRNRQLELERMVAESSSSISELQGNIARAGHAVAEVNQRKISRQKEYRKEVESQLSDVTREVQSDEVRFKSVTEDLGRTEIKAPVSGQVMSLAFQASGGVLPPGQKLMDVVPENEMLLLETRVAPNLIDRVHSGLPVDVRFSAFAHSPQLVVQGQVESVSSDLITEPQTNASYFLARVRVTPDGLKSLGKRQMQPGMPVEVVFKTGERSLLTYLLHPLTKRVAAAMKEE